MVSARLQVAISLLSLLLFANLPPAAGAAGDHQAKLQQAVDLMQQAEKLLVDDTPQALGKLKEARQLFKQLQQDLAGPLAAIYLTPPQLEQEAANTRVAEDLYHTGKRLETTAREKQERSRQLLAQGNKTAASNLADEAENELKLALQNYCRAELYSLKNQQLVFETVLKQTK